MYNQNQWSIDTYFGNLVSDLPRDFEDKPSTVAINGWGNIFITNSTFPSVCIFDCLKVGGDIVHKMLLKLWVMFTIRMKQHFCNIFNSHPMLEVEITSFLQQWQEEFICCSIEAKRICFLRVPFRKRFSVWFLV